ncbi:MAG: adenine phosphoribosyltransferase [Proteobacteria bacterium]|nr:adenine phosphoribosyltransferase [Pseudomonadota bacterium]
MTPAERLRARIREVPDFPRPGILFKDITPLLQDAAALQTAVDLLAEPFEGRAVDTVVGIESRGFILGAPLALALGAGFQPARKAGKLPRETLRESFELEYGNEQLEMHRDALEPGQRVLLCDDLIATGGTAAATSRLVQRIGAEIVGAGFLVELEFLDGRRALPEIEVHSVIRY